jgi:hypothetical protein
LRHRHRSGSKSDGQRAEPPIAQGPDRHDRIGSPPRAAKNLGQRFTELDSAQAAVALPVIHAEIEEARQARRDAEASVSREELIWRRRRYMARRARLFDRVAEQDRHRVWYLTRFGME